MSAAEMPAGATPEPTPDWHSIEWKNVWRTVRRLQARIVKAVDRSGRVPQGAFVNAWAVWGASLKYGSEGAGR